MTRVALPYCRVLASPPAARSTVTAHGNELVDIINQNHKQTHSAVQNLVFWPQPTLACYTPQYFYKAYHSVLAGGNAADFAFPLNFIPDPDLREARVAPQEYPSRSSEARVSQPWLTLSLAAAPTCTTWRS